MNRNPLTKWRPFDVVASLILSLITLISLFRGDPALSLALLWSALLFVLPFYTASLIAGDVASGSDQYLFTLPWSDGKLILTLYKFALLSVLKVLILPAAILLISPLFAPYDPGQILCGLAGLFLGTLTLASLGLLVSSLCSKTAVSWFMTIALLVLLNFLPRLLSHRVSYFFMGYGDFSYAMTMLAFSGLSLFLAWWRLSKKRGAVVQKGTLLLPLAFLILGSVIPGGVDGTLSGIFRVNRVTAKVLRGLEDPLYVRWYSTGNLDKVFVQAPRVELFIDSLRIKGGLRLRVTEISPSPTKSYDEIVLLAKQRGWTAQNFQEGEQYREVYSAVEVEYRGRTETIPLVYDPVILEEHLLAAVQRLQSDTHQRIGVMSGRSDLTLEDHGNTLIRSLGEFYQVVDYSGRADYLGVNPPEALFVLGEVDLSESEVHGIMDYIQGGGAALITLSSLELNPTLSDGVNRSAASPMKDELAELGITAGESYIVDPYRPLYLASDEGEAPELYPLWFRAGQRDLFTYYSLWSVPLYYTGDEDLLWSSQSSNRAFLAMGLNNIAPGALSQVTSTAGTNYTTAFAITVGEGTLVVISGEESLSDLMVLSNSDSYNGVWAQNMAFFLTDNSEMMTLRESSLGGRFP